VATTRSERGASHYSCGETTEEKKKIAKERGGSHGCEKVGGGANNDQELITPEGNS